MNINEKRKCKKKPFNSVSYTTGDIGLNIDRFNTAMGTVEGEEVGIGGDGALSEETKLQEAKRYVRRYYIRPMNIYASNKQEILKTLVDIGDQNCTIYTLNNLEDTDRDINKLSSRDIIYTYDNGILRDKNGISVLDYDLSIKKEENRKKFAKVDPSSKEFKSEYEDRMTSATELEESYTDIFADSTYDVIGADFTENGDKFVVNLNHNREDIEDVANELMFYMHDSGIYASTWNTNGSNVIIYDIDTDIEEEPFALTYEDYNAYGEKLNEAKEQYCSICGEPLDGDGHATENGIVCDGCELHFAIGG